MKRMARRPVRYTQPGGFCLPSPLADTFRLPLSPIYAGASRDCDHVGLDARTTTGALEK